MTSDEIKTHMQKVMPLGDLATWMREIAYQLAVMNERQEVQPQNLHVCPECNYSRVYREWPAGVECPCEPFHKALGSPVNTDSHEEVRGSACANCDGVPTGSDPRICCAHCQRPITTIPNPQGQPQWTPEGPITKEEPPAA